MNKRRTLITGLLVLAVFSGIGYLISRPAFPDRTNGAGTLGGTMKHRETEKDTGLDDTCEAFVGQLLSVNPVYGWGWGGNKEEPKPPPPFEMRLQRLWWWSGIRRGGIGTVNTPSHPYHGWTVIFSTRHTGTFNFVDRPGYYNITITSSDLVERQGWPLPREKVEGACGGFCAIEAKSADPEGKEKK